MSDNNMLRWDLESIFPGGSSSPQLAEFLEAIKTDLINAEKEFESLPKNLEDSTRSKWVAYFIMIQDIQERLGHAGGFVSCLCAQDVNDEKALTAEAAIDAAAADWDQLMTGIEELATDVDDDQWTNLVESKKLIGSKFFWDELRTQARLKMEPKLEKLATELAVNGYHAWGRLYNKMAGDLQTEFIEDGQKEVLSMGQLSTKFASPDRQVRKLAFGKLEESWSNSSSLASMALNFQAGYRLSLYKKRGWDSALFEPLMGNRMKQETLDAMWSAVEEGGKEMVRYIDAKKKLLGLSDFRWYDQVAPIGGSLKKISYQEAGDFCVKHLTSFSDEMGSFARHAIDNRWIESENRPGKAAGGFCTGVDLIKESRIFMTFSGNYDEMMTLAHEIGHAYHSSVLKDHDYFARSYPMNLAETASTFNELLVTDAALAASADDNERLILLDQKLQQGFIMFCNIYARYLFDVSFYKERAKGSVPKDRLNELMVEAQKRAFGSILPEDGYHPLFWASKLHFFITDAPFYNFPYTFGFLFSGGIYEQAKKEGPAFAESYKALLADTGSMTTEEVAQKHLGIDLTKPDFWNRAVSLVTADIDAFVDLAAKSG